MTRSNLLGATAGVLFFGGLFLFLVDGAVWVGFGVAAHTAGWEEDRDAKIESARLRLTSVEAELGVVGSVRVSDPLADEARARTQELLALQRGITRSLASMSKMSDPPEWWRPLKSAAMLAVPALLLAWAAWVSRQARPSS
jgi:hypothetical protein